MLNAKCKGLARGRWGDVVDRAAPAILPGGAALAAGKVAWVLAEDNAERSLGPAMAWAAKQGATELHLFASHAAGVVARRAAAFEPSPTVWSIDGTTLVVAVAEPITEPTPPPEADEFRSLFDEVGADAVVEAGVLRAEVLGLEVARVEVTDTGAKLAIGVGKHDRDAQREVHGSRPQGFDRLFEAVRVVAEHRVPGGAGHAAYQLAPERWLRAIVIRRPEVVGAASLHAVPSPVTRHDLRQSAPAPAAGVDASGAAVLVVCSVGVDLDLVPVAADAWAADGRKPRLVLCLPVGDDHRVTREQAAALKTPADIVTVGQEWRAL